MRLLVSNNNNNNNDHSRRHRRHGSSSSNNNNKKKQKKKNNSDSGTTTNWIRQVALPAAQERYQTQRTAYLDALLNDTPPTEEEEEEEELTPPTKIDRWLQVVTATANEWDASCVSQRRQARYERQLHEAYGPWLHAILKEYPVAGVWLKKGQAAWRQGVTLTTTPPLPMTSAVILLFLLRSVSLPNKQHNRTVQILAFLFFLVGLQPWALVLAVIMGRTLKQAWTRRRSRIPQKVVQMTQPYYTPTNRRDKLNQVIGTPTLPTTLKEFHVLLVGDTQSSLETLYTAALLSRAGYKCLILTDTTDASGCCCNDLSLESPILTKLSQQQESLWVPALCHVTDCLGGIRFASLNTAPTRLVSVPTANNNNNNNNNNGQESLWVTDLLQSVAIHDPDALTAVMELIQNCQGTNATAGAYFIQHRLGNQNQNKNNKNNKDDNDKNAYAACTLRTVEQVWRGLPATARALTAAVAGATCENVRPLYASLAVYVSQLASLSNEKEEWHVPVGGARALGHALATVVEQMGGKIVTQAAVAEFVFDDSVLANNNNTNNKSDEEGEQVAPTTCVGVKLRNGQTLRFAAERYQTPASTKLPAVVSMRPFIETFVRLCPTEIRDKHGCPPGLPSMAEQRPVFYLIVELEGTADDLQLTSTEYLRAPQASVPVDRTSADGTVHHGSLGWATHDDFYGQETPTSAGEHTGESTAKATRACRFEAGTSWMRVTFPSTHDPSFAQRHPNQSVCVVTIEADDDFVTRLNSKPVLFVPKKKSAAVVAAHKNLEDRLKGDLLSLYPQLVDKIRSTDWHGPVSRGACHTPHRFVAHGLRTTHADRYRQLFYGGRDLTVGNTLSAGIVAGWIAANAVCGYQPWDLTMWSQSLTTDWVRACRDNPGEDDEVAVPLEDDDEDDEHVKSKDD